MSWFTTDADCARLTATGLGAAAATTAFGGAGITTGSGLAGITFTSTGLGGSGIFTSGSLIFGGTGTGFGGMIFGGGGLGGFGSGGFSLMLTGEIRSACFALLITVVRAAAPMMTMISASSTLTIIEVKSEDLLCSPELITPKCLN